jgi:hypothetical protein
MCYQPGRTRPTIWKFHGEENVSLRPFTRNNLKEKQIENEQLEKYFSQLLGMALLPLVSAS